MKRADYREALTGAYNVMILAAAVLRDKGMPKAAEALNDHAITLLEMVGNDEGEPEA